MGDERAAGFVLFRCAEGRCLFLLLKHRGEDYWAFPKGRIDRGETEREAALRELNEETGIAQVCWILEGRVESRYNVQRDGRSVSKTVAFFLGETLQEDVVLSCEHDAFRWLGYHDALERLTYPESRRVLDEAYQVLTDAGRHGR